MVKAPAMVLFVGFILFSFNNSIVDSFLAEARRLVSHAPDGKVEICVPNVLSEQKNVNLKNIPPPPVYEKPCEKMLIDASDWKRSLDATIWDAYWLSAVYGFFVWLVCKLNFSELIRVIKKKRSKL